MPEQDNVAAVKQCLVDSKQVALAPEDMALYDNGALLEDHTTIQHLFEKNGICTYAVLTIRREGVSPLLGASTIGTIFPAPNSANVRLNMPLCVVLASHVRILNPNDVIEVRGPKDYFCYGDVTCEAERDATILTFKPKSLFVPGSKYCVRLRAAAIEPAEGATEAFSDTVWTFESAPTPPLRVLATDICNPQEQLLVTIPRYSCSMFSELRTVLASRFDCRIGCVSGIHTKRNGKRVPIENDSDVYELREGDDLVFEKADEPQALEQPDLSHEPRYESYVDYVKDHFANWRCGFWAVCGKMSFDEEMSIINAMIAADEAATPEEVPSTNMTADEEAATASVPQQPPMDLPGSADVIPVENIVHPHWVPIENSSDLLDPRLTEDAVPLFRACALADPVMRAEAVRTWHKRQYVMIELPSTHSASCKEVQLAAQQFFLRPEAEKLTCVDERERYLGYAERPAFHKELFQARRTSMPDPTHWPAFMPELQSVATANFDLMESVCHDMLALACSELGFPTEYVAQLTENAADAGNGLVSMSNLTLFKYGQEGKTVDWLHLPYHTDIGLVTTIPRAAGHGGLHVYDWVLNSWVDIEADLPDGFALVFGGEALTFLTQGYIPAALHDVSHVEGVRISSPFQCLPAASAMLDRSQLDIARAKALSPDFDPCNTHSTIPSVVGGQQFVHQLSSQRVSTNFPRQAEVRFPDATAAGRDVFHQAQPSQRA